MVRTTSFAFSAPLPRPPEFHKAAFSVNLLRTLPFPDKGKEVHTSCAFLFPLVSPTPTLPTFLPLDVPSPLRTSPVILSPQLLGPPKYFSPSPALVTSLCSTCFLLFLKDYSIYIFSLIDVCLSEKELVSAPSSHINFSPPGCGCDLEAPLDPTLPLQLWPFFPYSREFFSRSV